MVIGIKSLKLKGHALAGFSGLVGEVLGHKWISSKVQVKLKSRLERKIFYANVYLTDEAIFNCIKSLCSLSTSCWELLVVLLRRHAAGSITLSVGCK